MSVKQSKRFVPVSAFMRNTGLSYPTVMNGIKNGEISAIQTESGQYRIDTHSNGNTDVNELVSQLEEQGRMLKALCKQFNVSI